MTHDRGNHSHVNARDERRRVLINLCWLVPGVVGGSEGSTTDAIRALVDSRQREFEFELAVLRPFLTAHPDLAEALQCHVVPIVRGSKVARVFAEQTWLARVAARRNADLVHHAGGVVPLIHQDRIVLTVHDLQPLEYPKNFSFAKRTYMRRMLGRSVHASNVVCVPSEFTGERVSALLHADRDRIVYVPWSTSDLSDESGKGSVVAGSARGARKSVSGGRADDAPLYPGWTPERRFILYPSITYPHKRHLLLIDAFEHLADAHPDVDLVLTGGEDQMEPAVAQAIAASPVASRIKRLGRVPSEQLERLYESTVVMAYPSSYEGFGLPVLEAMTKGVLVVASWAGSIPELVPNDWMVHGEDAALWSAALSEVLSLSRADANDRRARGRRIAASYSPRRTAAALLDAYRMALDDSGARA